MNNTKGDLSPVKVYHIEQIFDPWERICFGVPEEMKCERIREWSECREAVRRE